MVLNSKSEDCVLTLEVRMEMRITIKFVHKIPQHARPIYTTEKNV